MADNRIWYAGRRISAAVAIFNYGEARSRHGCVHQAVENAARMVRAFAIYGPAISIVIRDDAENRVLLAWRMPVEDIDALMHAQVNAARRILALHAATPRMAA